MTICILDYCPKFLDLFFEGVIPIFKTAMTFLVQGFFMCYNQYYFKFGSSNKAMSPTKTLQTKRENWYLESLILIFTRTQDGT